MPNGVDHPFAIVPCLMLAEVKPTSVVVYAVLAEHANADQESWPSVGRIARRANLAESTVRSAVQELQEKGWLTVRGRATEDGRQTSNLYKIRRIRNSDLTPQVSEGAPLKKQQGHPPRTDRRTRSNEPYPSNSARPKYPTAEETKALLAEYEAAEAVDATDRLRDVRDQLR